MSGIIAPQGAIRKTETVCSAASVAVLSLCLLLLAPGFASAADRTAREAVEALEAYAVYKMARYPEAYARFLALAHKGNIQGMLNLANMLQAGLGVDRDATAALDWYRKAGEQGSAIGMFYTAKAYQHGIGTHSDPARARFWLRRAALAGFSEAQLVLGKLLLEEGNQADARHWLNQAVRNGDLAAAGYLNALDESAPTGHTVGTVERALIDAAWDAIDRAAQNRNAPGAVHYLAQDAEIRVRLPDAQNWIPMSRSALRDFWRETFKRAQTYSYLRGQRQMRAAGDRIAVESVIDESVGTDGRTTDLRLQESALVAITGDRVVIEQLSLEIIHR